MSVSFRFAAVYLALLASSAHAQSTFGSITGTVKDSTGAVIPSVEVEVVNEGTGTSRKVLTSSAGVFNVPNLDIGSYRVCAAAAGFPLLSAADCSSRPTRSSISSCR